LYGDLPSDAAMIKRKAIPTAGSRRDLAPLASHKATQKAENAELCRLVPEDQRRFAEALIDPPPLAPAMKHAREHHRRLVGPE
jgi:uncharacterized protein (DUF1778 family)